MFEIETVYNEKTFVEFQKLINSTLRVKRLKITRALFFLVGAISIVLAVMWISAKEAVPAVASILMAAVFLLAGVFFEKYTMMGKKHSVNQSVRSITYYFNKKNFSAQEKSGLKESPYSTLKYILESDTCFAMMLGPRQGFVLSKSGFKKGSPEDFSKFIEEKTGLTMMRAPEASA